MKFKGYLFYMALLICSCKKETSKIGVVIDQTAVNALKINQYQYLGSHNSYHKRMSTPLYQSLKVLNNILPDELDITALDYWHETIEDQLNIYNLRTFEIDIYNDTAGGLFYRRRGNALAGLPEASGIDVLKDPGLKVLHIPDIDFETHVYTFKDALQKFKNWSDEHPNHVPITILVETKAFSVGSVIGLGFAEPIPFTKERCDEIDEEIKSVFGVSLEKIITPDDVRGSYPTLEEAVLANNWPTLGESRGKFMFVMIGEGRDDYLIGHPSLQGRVLFTGAEEGHPEAAVLLFDNPIEDWDNIVQAINKGYMVRSRCDSPGNQNKTNDYIQQDAAFRSGAQILSTDYYRPDTRFSTYSCQLPNEDLIRVNPRNVTNASAFEKVVE